MSVRSSYAVVRGSSQGRRPEQAMCVHRLASRASTGLRGSLGGHKIFLF
jgi:hypothetical protein